jgi:hypothetical protein
MKNPKHEGEQDPCKDKGLAQLEWLLVCCMAFYTAAFLWANWGN